MSDYIVIIRKYSTDINDLLIKSGVALTCVFDVHAGPLIERGIPRTFNSEILSKWAGQMLSTTMWVVFDPNGICIKEKDEHSFGFLPDFNIIHEYDFSDPQCTAENLANHILNHWCTQTELDQQTKMDINKLLFDPDESGKIVYREKNL